MRNAFGIDKMDLIAFVDANLFQIGAVPLLARQINLICPSNPVNIQPPNVSAKVGL